MNMSRRKIPFPSNIEGCEALLDEYRRPQRYGLRYSATHTIGDMPRCEENFDMILPPFHINSLFTARDALTGAYGDSRMKKRTVVKVEYLSNPKKLEDVTDVIYRVSWPWAGRHFTAQGVASWVIEPRGERYSDKHIAAMALFRTYYRQLEGQDYAQHAWESRRAEAKAFLAIQKPGQALDDAMDRLLGGALQHALSTSVLSPADTQAEQQSRYEVNAVEPTNEELGLPPAQPQYEQPRWSR